MGGGATRKQRKKNSKSFLSGFQRSSINFLESILQRENSKKKLRF